MDKLAFLDDLLAMAHTGELAAQEPGAAERLLPDIKRIVQESLRNELYEVLTDQQTSYCAPEYSCWKEFLKSCNAEYAVILEEFTEERLGMIWQSSHIMEELSDEQIKEELILQIEQLKAMEYIQKFAHSNAPELVRARIKGLFEIYGEGLYEG